MARRLKNKFVDVLFPSLAKTIKLFEVKLPFPVNIAINEKNVDGSDAGSLVMSYPALYSDKDKLIEEAKKQGYDIEVKQLIIKIIAICPQCHREGIPKVEEKNNEDKRSRSWRNKDPKKSNLVKRQREFWLTYDHKSKPFKCRIKQYIGNSFNTFKPNKRKNISSKELTMEGLFSTLHKNQ